GQEWARVLTRRGDRHCRANQRLRLQTQDAQAIIRRHPYRTPRLYEHRSTSAWMSRIEVPTFLVGQFQDEQTSGHFASALGLLEGNPRVWITLQNGVHVDSLGPDTTTRWVEFLKLYVAGEVPEIPDPIRGLSDSLYRLLADAPASPLQQSRFAGRTDVAAARAEFERDPRVRLLMDNGAGPAGPGALGAAWELGYDAWPVREVAATSYWFGLTGELDRRVPAGFADATYTADPSARPPQTLAGSGEADAWKADPPYDWRPVATGKGLGFTTAPLEQDLVIAGPSSVDLYLKSSAPDTDVQVTLSEVRPDGAETYVQSGWLRASQRKLDPVRSTSLAPVQTHLPGDARPIPLGRYTIVRVPVFPVAHAFRAGSRIRVTIQAPGGDRARWAFDSLDDGTARNTIGIGGNYASKLVLPVVQGATALGTPLPPPRALRGQPSRRYVPASNGG
ncbi:MAG: peptidase S15, partial [Actinomycetota bacterium]|nr:peptidase S15 [Actinomycetota bacterium]